MLIALRYTTNDTCAVGVEEEPQGVRKELLWRKVVVVCMPHGVNLPGSVFYERFLIIRDHSFCTGRVVAADTHVQTPVQIGRDRETD